MNNKEKVIMKMFEVKVVDTRNNDVEDSFILSKTEKAAAHDVLSFRNKFYQVVSVQAA